MQEKRTWDDIYRSHPIRHNLIEFLPLQDDEYVFYSPEACAEGFDLKNLLAKREEKGCAYAIVACDNKYALKMFAGVRDEKGQFFSGILDEKESEKLSYSKRELESQLEENGITEYRFFYPYPNYQLPLCIYSDVYQPKCGELSNNQRNFATDRAELFDETEAWNHIIRDGLFTTFSNSFLLVIGPRMTWPDGEVLFSKFSNDRDERFNIRTDILQKDGKLVVKKSPMSASAKNHIEKMYHNMGKLEEAYVELDFNKCSLSDDMVKFEFLSGESLDEKLIQLLNAEKEDEFIALVNEYIHKISSCSNDNIIDVDMIFKNILITDDGKWNVLDYEWTFDKSDDESGFVQGLTLEFVIYRSIYYFIEDNHLGNDVSKRLYELIHLTDEKSEEYRSQEEAFQKYVSKDHESLGELYGRFHGKTYRVIEDIKEMERQNKVTVSEVPENQWYDTTTGDLHEIRIFLTEAVDTIEVVLGHCNLIADITEVTMDGRDISDTIETNGYHFYNRMFIFGGDKPEPRIQIPIQGQMGELYIRVIMSNQGDNTSAAFKTLNHYIISKDLEKVACEREKEEIMSTRLERAKKYYKKYGFKKTLKKTYRVARKILMQKRVWKYYKASKQELKQWQNETFESNPKFSILIPMYNTPVQFFKELMETIQGQIYSNWELCLADGSGKDTEAYAYVMELQKTDDRIKYKRLESNGGISENTNAALDMATGDFIVLCDHDDLLTVDALYHVVKAINENQNIDTLYTDEDKVDMDGKKHFEPSFKPDFNIDFLRGGNYICHMFVTRREIAQKVRFKKEYDGAQDFDFIFRCCEASREIYHIPRVLYHWRCHINSTAANPESKLYAYEAGVKALQAHLDRNGINASARMSEFLGYYLVDYQQMKKPKVSVISTDKLSRDVYDSIMYENKELVSMEGAYTPANINRTIKEKATGDILFFLDPRVEKLEDDCFERLLAPLGREDLVSTFAKVKNKEDMLYSVGIITGIGGSFGRSFPGVEYENNGYAMRLFIPQNLSAADLSCAMLKREAFDHVGGMDETMSYLCSAVDLFLKMGKTGKLHLLETRAVATIDAKVDGAFEWMEIDGATEEEMYKFIEKWPEVKSHLDRNYNPNFTKKYAGYTVKTWIECKDGV